VLAQTKVKFQCQYQYQTVEQGKNFMKELLYFILLYFSDTQFFFPVQILGKIIFFTEVYYYFICFYLAMTV